MQHSNCDIYNFSEARIRGVTSYLLNFSSAAFPRIAASSRFKMATNVILLSLRISESSGILENRFPAVVVCRFTVQR